MKILKCVWYLSFQMLLTKSNSDPLFTENEKLLDTNLTFKIDPPSLIPGVQVEVNLLCTFRRYEFPDMASVFSMIIAHSSNPTLPVYNYIASVNQVEGHAHNISHDVRIISGSVDNNGESSLHVRFNYPEINLTGAYMCEVYGFDQIGKPMTKYNSQILFTNNITDVYSLVRQHQHLVSSLQACIQNQTELVITLLSIRFPVLLSNFYPPVINNGHAYYLTKNLTYFEYFAAQRVCEEFGGYLVELDDHSEFIFVRDFISPFHFSEAIWTGATDRGHNNTWLNPHSSTIPTFDWAPGEPKQTSHCQCFHKIYIGLLGECFCTAHNYNFAYLCEVPLHIY